MIKTSAKLEVQRNFLSLDRVSMETPTNVLRDDTAPLGPEMRQGCLLFSILQFNTVTEVPERVTGQER